MSSRLRVLLTVAAVVAFGWVAGRIPDALARMELFEIRTVRVEGARWLTDEEAARTLALPPGTNLWEDPAPWVDRIRQHPLVAEARARRRIPGTLVLKVVERQPVALLPAPALEPVDPEGHRLPIDPVLHRLDLPLLQPHVEGARDDRVLTPARLRVLASELSRLAEAEPDFLASVSEVAMDEAGDVMARLASPTGVTVRFRVPLASRRLQEGWVVLDDALRRRPGVAVRALDLRFADQVVVHFEARGS
jgi:cell division protein FtsQ